MTLYRWKKMINPLRVLTCLFLMAVLVLGSWQSSYATDDEITAILKPGNTKIEMRLKRPWESSTLKAKVYQISILSK
jgi:hypothetical protein